MTAGSEAWGLRGKGEKVGWTQKEVQEVRDTWIECLGSKTLLSLLTSRYSLPTPRGSVKGVLSGAMCRRLES